MKNNKPMKILALDPSGTSTTGIFLFENWTNWKIISYTDKNYLNQAKNIQELAKKEQVNLIVCEVSSLWEKSRHNYHFLDLIKLTGIIEWISQELGIEFVPISNQYMNRWKAEAKERKIAGLSFKQIQGKTGRPKGVWYFKDRELNDHEKDALLIFWIYWVKFKKREWPFTN
ncbi:hypothetical protein [endosymbiont GvMRE of Glomus versiforme]|uniref:hypothetical protein n=1 Tax=endosymbiont GvMRE of Glomus versiforme TaxID=2039283 RepID=UPI000ED34D3C|nr:hypothetical protein [endosymbiont GvMRE of Glomus versiforme]RHZ36316.1 hypothetical protein GvMRE_Ic1g45 [endosymbiont GvMRE of Glomus versiforme]RHZ37719.1 hypothetical protein GvMRE_I1g687 [endosymbiont GvMRE of Glomus versiforme]